MHPPQVLHAAALSHAHARNWYDRAWAACVEVAGPDADMLARLIATLSPQASVRQNAAWAVYALAAWRRGAGMYDKLPVGRFRHVRERVASVLAGGPVTGPKCSAFYAAITGDVDAVAIDTFVLRAMGLDPRPAPHVARYASLATYLRTCASIIDWPAREFQAALWAAAPRQRAGEDMAWCLRHYQGLLLQGQLSPLIGPYGTRSASEE